MSNKEEPDQDTLERWHQDPSNWKWGIFYYNKEDKRIFPPKRWKGLGWTINFANPYSIGAVLVLFIAIYYLLKYWGV